MVRSAARVLACLITAGAGTLQAQSGSADGPITASAREAAFIKVRLAADATLEAKLQADYPVALEFVKDPLSFIALGKAVPDQKTMLKAREVAQAKRGLGGGIAPAGGAAGASTESLILIGTADFVIARTKSELVASAFRQAKQWFKDDSTLPRLFPAANRTLDDVDQVSPQFVSTLRTNARKDLDSLPVRLWQLSKERCSTVGATCTPAHNRFVDAQRGTSLIARAVIRKESPLAAIARVGKLPTTDFVTQEGRILTRSLVALGTEAASGGGDRFLESARDTKQVVYLGVLLAHAILDQSDVAGLANSAIEARLSAVVDGIADAAEEMNTTYKAYQDLRDADNLSSAERRERYGAMGLTFAEAAYRAAQAGLPLLPDSKQDDAKQVLMALGTSVEVVKALMAEDYLTAAVAGVATLAATGETGSPRLRRWAALAGGVSTARTSEDITAVIEQFALPPASYYAKRFPGEPAFARTAVHINAYLGISGGSERLHEVPAGAKRDAFFGGVSLPIGVEVALAKSRAALFIGVLDLGAVASYRLGDSSSDVAPSITFANVVAPGAFVTVGLSRSFPLAFGVGAQYAPRLRNVTGATPRDASRIQAFFASDVPLFRLR